MRRLLIWIVILAILALVATVIPHPVRAPSRQSAPAGAVSLRLAGEAPATHLTVR